MSVTALSNSLTSGVKNDWCQPGGRPTIQGVGRQLRGRLVVAAKFDLYDDKAKAGQYR